MLADGGYGSGEALQALEDHNIEGYIPNFGQYKYERAGFTYSKDEDKYTCSRGVELPFKKISTSSLNYEKRVPQKFAGLRRLPNAFAMSGCKNRF